MLMSNFIRQFFNCTIQSKLSQLTILRSNTDCARIR